MKTGAPAHDETLGQTGRHWGQLGAIREDLPALILPPEAAASASPIASALEGIALFVTRATTFPERDRETAKTCLNNAAALLGSDGQTSVAHSIPAFRRGGLARWQATRAVAHIEANLESMMCTDQLAELAGICSSYFYKAFKRSFGIPPMQYVALRRVDRAKVMITSTRKQLLEIALACGFADQPHLTKWFTRIVGASPGRWRRANTLAPTPTSTSVPGCGPGAAGPTG